jgi:hypothetical protein
MLNMPRDDRLKLIEAIQTERKSKVIVYMLGDRPNFLTNIADDAIRIIFDHLENIGKQDAIDLFLYARGGNIVPSFRVVKLIREYCKKFSILVPYRAHSAATLLALGADEIVMGKMGELSPIDPTTSHPFNPQDPADPKKRVPISVEDVTSYMRFATEKAGLSEEKKIDIFQILTNYIHPLALGNIERGYGLIRELAPELLRLHMKNKEKIQKIIELLAERKVHGYMICRDEANKELKLPILEPPSTLEESMWSLYEAYEEDLKLREPFDPNVSLGSQPSTTFSIEAAYIESVAHLDAFVFEGTINRRAPVQIQLPGVVPGPPPTAPTPAPPTRPIAPTPQPTAPPSRPARTLTIGQPVTVTFTSKRWKRIV